MALSMEITHLVILSIAMDEKKITEKLHQGILDMDDL